MPFANDKKTFLAKPDKSRAGEMDEAIKPLVDLINSKEEYYTTSSCAGRILLLQQGPSGRKEDARHFFVSHDPIDLDALRKALQDLPEDEILFRMEGLILHVCCEDLPAAERLLGLARDAGLKRSGITSIANKITVEIIDTQRLELPLAKGGKLLVPEEYLSYLLEEANEKLKGTRKKMEKFAKAAAL